VPPPLPAPPQEIDALCEEWRPEPLVPPLPAANRLSAPPVLAGCVGACACENTSTRRLCSRARARRPTGPHVTLASGVEAINFVSYDFLGLAGDKSVQARAAPPRPREPRRTLTRARRRAGRLRRRHPEIRRGLLRPARLLRHRGCAPPRWARACAPALPPAPPPAAAHATPRAADVHLELEVALARYMGTEEAMIYSYDVATPASTIPAFSKRGDLLVVDEGVNYALQAGVTLSRSEVRYFKHNDVADLERVLNEVAAEDAAARRSTAANRRFILVEGVYANYGDIAPLAAICALKRRFCYRLLVDEALAFGALPGGAGRGAADHAGLAPGEVEIITASLGNTLGSCGGFCAGDKQVISHQRLNASGYCFSASLPPYLASGAIAALRVLGDSGARRAALARNAAALRAGIAALPGVAPLVGEPCCPLLHLRLAPAPRRDADAEAALLARVCDRTLAASGVLLATAKYSVLERRRPPPSIRLAVSAAHSDADIAAALAALRAALAAEGVR
jgi:7-keto-8-aminopelargonate synthetase-like enzyme